MSVTGPRQRRSESRIGHWLACGFRAYGEQWRAWLDQMLLVLGVCLLAAMCGGFPIVLIAGPVSSGLHASALLAVRRHPVAFAPLICGWRLAGPSVTAFFSLTCLQTIPALLVFLWNYRDSMGILRWRVEHLLWEIVHAPLVLTGIQLAAVVWAVGIGTRTMFVMPLIAGRTCSFIEAFAESWRLTKSRFGELLLAYCLAVLIGGLGLLAWYIGVLVTLPLYYTILAAAYDAHALAQYRPEADAEVVADSVSTS